MSQRDSGHARKERDLYETPSWVTEAFCQHLWRSNWGIGMVWEPAAGSGKMVDVLKKYVDGDGHCIVGSDVEPLRTDVRQIDFLKVKDFPSSDFGGFGAIVTNPPYDKATEFVEHSLKLADTVDHGVLVAMLLRTDFDHAKSRSHLFRDCPAFMRKLVLTRRITWFEPEPGAKGKSPSFNHAWFMWFSKNEGAPTLAYGP